jgi:XapX domain-containing protein
MMKAYFLSFVIGLGVGVVYAMLRVKSPAPPLVALVGLLGMVLGEGGYAWLKTMIHQSRIQLKTNQIQSFFFLKDHHIYARTMDLGQLKYPICAEGHRDSHHQPQA